MRRHPHPIIRVYVGERRAAKLKLVGSFFGFIATASVLSAAIAVKVSAEHDYYVDALAIERDLVYLTLRPVRDPERNRLREVYANKATYEVTRLIAHDELYTGRQIFDTTFDIRVGNLDGRPIVTSIHGKVGKPTDGTEYFGDGKAIDYTFTKVKFSAQLPEPYFNARTHVRRTSNGAAQLRATTERNLRYVRSTIS